MHSGYVALIGRPNVGKSTLLNTLVGEKISIVSAKPQTTRNRISAIYSSDEGQIVFLDTPGIHRATGELNRYMVDVALRSLADVDVVVVIVEAIGLPKPQDLEVIGKVIEHGKSTLLVVNKIDRVPKPTQLPLIDTYRQLGPFVAILPVSARTGEGVADLRAELFRLLPKHEPYFPVEQLTELPERFIVAEMIREKVFELLRDEVPYSTAVEVESFEESNPELVRIRARIIVEREGQKGILIGKGGHMLKEIGTRARLDIERLLATRVFLELFVKVVPNWTRNPAARRRLGYA